MGHSFPKGHLLIFEKERASKECGNGRKRSDQDTKLRSRKRKGGKREKRDKERKLKGKERKGTERKGKGRTGGEKKTRCGRGWKDRERNSQILERNGAGWVGKVRMLEWEKLEYDRVERRVKGKGGGAEGEGYKG